MADAETQDVLQAAFRDASLWRKPDTCFSKM